MTQANQLAGSHQYDDALGCYHQALHMYDQLAAESAAKAGQLADLVTAAAERSDGAAFVLYSGKHEEEEARRVETLKDTAKTLNNLAAVLHQLRRFDEAMRAYERALEAKRASLGAAHFSVGHTLYNLACLQLDNENPAAAAHYMRETLAIYGVAFGPDHQLTGDVEKQLAILEEGLARQKFEDDQRAAWEAQGEAGGGYGDNDNDDDDDAAASEVSEDFEDYQDLDMGNAGDRTVTRDRYAVSP